MQDEVRDKSVALAITVGKNGGRLTADLLKWAIRRYLTDSSHSRAPHGKQTLKQLVRQGAGVQNIEITDKNIRSFERVARKYGVDFALKKVPEEGKYLVFFKARDADALNAAFAEYTAKTIKRGKEKPSVRQQLRHLMEQLRDAVQDREKNRDKGEISR